MVLYLLKFVRKLVDEHGKENVLCSNHFMLIDVFLEEYKKSQVFTKTEKEYDKKELLTLLEIFINNY
jgi:hypothetical protein